MNARFALEPMERRVLLSAGQLDPSFGNGGRVVETLGGVFATAIAPDGKIVVASRDASGAHTFIARYTKSGARDTTFNGGAPVSVHGVQQLRVLADGRIEFTNYGAEVGRLLQNGALDPTLNPRGAEPGYQVIPSPIPNVSGGAAAIQPDGRFVYIGYKSPQVSANQRDIYVARVNLDGTFDTSFGSDGTTFFAASNMNVYDVTVADDGTIALAGQDITGSNTNAGFVTRLSSSGAALTKWSSWQFDEFSRVINVAPLSGGKFLADVVGKFFYVVPMILDATGTNATPITLDGVDWTKPTGPWVSGDIPHYQLQPHIIDSAGRYYMGQSIGNDFAVSRYTPEGHVDTTFGSGGVARIAFDDRTSHTITNLNFDKNGRLVITGADSNGHVVFAALHDSSPTDGGNTGGRHRHRYHTSSGHHRTGHYRTVVGPRYRTHH